MVPHTAMVYLDGVFVGNWDNNWTAQDPKLGNNILVDSETFNSLMVTMDQSSWSL